MAKHTEALTELWNELAARLNLSPISARYLASLIVRAVREAPIGCGCGCVYVAPEVGTGPARLRYRCLNCQRPVPEYRALRKAE